MIRIRSPTKKKVNRMSISDWKRKNSNRFLLKEKEKFLMKQEMININANLLAEPTFSNFDKEGETVEVANFTLVKSTGKARSISTVPPMEKNRRKQRTLKKAI